MKYGTILYEVRDDLDLTNNEYLLLDAVRNLQGGRQTPGWCNASIAYLAYVAGVNRRNTFKLVERLEQKSLLESGPNPGLRRVSQTFENAIINRKKLDLYDANATKEVVSKRHQSVAAGGVEKTPEVVSKRHQDWCRKDTTTGVEKTPNITVYNTVDNTLYNDVVEQKTTTPPPTSKKIEKIEIEKRAPPQTQPAQPPALPWRSSPEFQAGADKFGQALRGRGILPENLDVEYYFGRGAEWSDNSTAKTGTAPVAADWLGKIHGWAVADMNAGKLRIIQQVQHTAYDGTTYTIPGNPTHTGNNAGRKPKYSNGRPDPAECAASARRVIARLTAEGYGT